MFLFFQDDGKIAVQFVDYGNCYLAPISSALQLPSRANVIPPLAFPVTLNDGAYVIPTGSLDAATIAHLTVETPTYTIEISPNQPIVEGVAGSVPPSKRPSINAIIKDAVKTLNILDVLAAAGIVKLRPVQSPAPAPPKPLTAASISAKLEKFRADTLPPCPFVPEVGVPKKILITEVISLAQIYVQVCVKVEFLAGSIYPISIVLFDCKT